MQEQCKCEQPENTTLRVKVTPIIPSCTMTNYPFASSYFSLRYALYHKRVKLTFVVQPEFASTSSLPYTSDFLQTNCPGVLDTQCHNYDHLPFREEVKKTELGHLFEHLLLTCMRDEKEKAGQTNFCISAQTDWNWRKQEKGIFHIKVAIEDMDEKMFALALFTSCRTMQGLLSFHSRTAGRRNLLPASTLSTVTMV